MSGAVAAEQRYRRERRCPICAGCESDPRGMGVRCTGFISDDGGTAFCSREERAGRLEVHAATGAYLHRLRGTCGCGERHGAVDAAPFRRSREIASYDYRSESGELLYQVVRFEPKEFRQRRPDGKGGWNWKLGDVRRVLYRLPKLLDREHRGQVVLIVEGERDVHTAEDLAQLATCNSGGAGKWNDEFSASLASHRVVIVPDADEPGRRHAAQVFASLQRAGVVARILDLPGAAKDLSAWREAGGTREQLQELIDTALTSDLGANPTPPSDTRPTISITTDEAAVADQAIAAVADSGVLFQRGGILVRLSRGTHGPLARDTGAPWIGPVPQASLRELLADRARWTRIRPTGEVVAAHPPEWCVRAVEARGEWRGIPYLAGVIETPTLRLDGTVLDRAGYDSASALLYEPGPGMAEIRIPSTPTRDQARAAAAKLLDVIGDFPVMGHGRAAWVAVVVTACARHAIDGPVPLIVIDASTRGSGKTLLAELVSIIATGRTLARCTSPMDDDEARKRITAIALAGDALVLLDNVIGRLGTASLDAALTATTWRDRILGVSAMTAALPLTTIWLATGNNLQLVGDTARRALYLRLEPAVERPEDRRDFRRPRLPEWTRAHRADLVAAALTMLRAYCAAGRPDMRLTPWGSYEAWSDLIRSACVWADLADPAAGRADLSQVDGAAAQRRALIHAWAELGPEGSTVAAALRRLAETGPGELPGLRAAIAEIGRDGRHPSASMLGYRLRATRGTIVDGLRLVGAADRDGVQRWKVVNAGDAGHCGASPPPYAGTPEREEYASGPDHPPQSPSSPAPDGGGS